MTDQQKEDLKQEIKNHVDKYREDHFMENYPSGQGHIKDWVWIAVTEFCADQFSLINALKEQVENLKTENEELRRKAEKKIGAKA